MPECYIRGSTIKYLRIPDEVIDMVKEDIQMKSRGRGEMKGRGQSQRGRGSGRGNFVNLSTCLQSHIFYSFFLFLLLNACSLNYKFLDKF